MVEAGFRKLLASMLTGLLLTLGWVPAVLAHGKTVNLAIACVAPDPARPLARICTGSLEYADGDPVSDARFEITARREGKAEAALGVIRFRPAGREGNYSASVTFPAYGRWRMRFQVLEPGSGEAELVEDLLPPVAGAATGVRANLQVVFQFGLTDVRNLALRITHLLAAAAWFVIIMLVLVLSRLPGPEQRWKLLARLTVVFPWTAGASLLLLAFTGVANAVVNAPTRSPGLFAPEAIARLPFGKAYLAVFGLKMILTLAVVVATAALGLALRSKYGRPVPIIAGAARDAGRLPLRPDRALSWLAAINLLMGVLTFISVVVLGYLHMITHVAAAAGAR